MNDQNKSFRQDLIFLLNRLKEKKHFSFSKYADGEYKLLRNESISYDNWAFNPQDHQKAYQYLLHSFKYNHPDYYIGISCPCCQPLHDVQWMRDNVLTENLTWANMFVNSNYDFFKKYFFVEFNNWEHVTLVANKHGAGKELPFKTSHYESIETDGWLNPDHTIDRLKERSRQIDGQLFLFSAGPLGNILAHQLHEDNPFNTYIDIGSTINPWTTGRNRSYLYGGGTLNKVCIW